MQAIILAAGMGKRLRDLTSNNTKCMIEVNGVKLIDRMLEQLSTIELKKVIIVVGYQGAKLTNYIGNRYDNKLNIEYITNPIYDKTNNIYSLALAKNKMREDDTLLLESDLIFDTSLLTLIINNPYPNIALVAKYQTWMDGTMVRIDEDNNIINFIPKKAFKYSDVQHYYKTVNIYKFSKDFSANKYIPFLDAYCKALGNNEYYEQVLRIITFLDKSEIKALPISNENWYEIDDIQDLDIAETLFAENNDRLTKYFKRYGGYWRFPHLLDFCYLVNPYYPTQHLKDELRANFDILLTEYPSGMYVNSLLASKCFGIKQDYIIPGNGAAELIKSLMFNLEGKLGVVYPTFEEYPNRKEDKDLVIFIPDNTDYHYSVNDLISYFCNKDISSLLLINPDNPSGNFISKEDILTLVEWCRKQQMNIVVDESFIDFSEGHPNNTLLDNTILEQYENLFVMKSISKSFGVPGLRLGILASANKYIIDKIKKDVAIWNINSFAEFYMQIYSKYTADYNVACEKFLAERNRFYKDLQQISFLRIIPSQANYFLCEVLAPFTSKELVATMLKRFDILLKDCSTKKAFDGQSYIRIAVRNTADNKKLVNCLKQLN